MRTTVDWRKVAALYDAGMPGSLIARELSCSTSRVQQITAELEPPENMSKSS